MWSASICPTKPRGWTGWCISSATALAGVLPGSTIPRGIQPKLKTLVLLTCDFICRQLLQLDIVSGREYLVQLKAANESRQMIALPLSRIYQTGFRRRVGGHFAITLRPIYSHAARVCGKFAAPRSPAPSFHSQGTGPAILSSVTAQSQ